MKKFRFIILMPLLMAATGCMEDNSQYGGNEIGNVHIRGIGSLYEIEHGSRLVITPEITVEAPVREEDLTYAWVKYNATQPIPDTISTEKNLDIELPYMVSGVKNYLSLRVTDSRTGLFYITYAELRTVGVYSGGILALCRTGSECDMSFIKNQGEVFYENIYSAHNRGQKLPPNCRRFFFSDCDATNPWLFKSVIVASEDHSGGVYLNPDSLIRKSSMRDMFIFPDDLPEIIDVTHYNNGMDGDFLVVDGKLYSRGNTKGQRREAVIENRWAPPAVVKTEPSDYSLSSCSSNIEAYPFYGKPIFYDELQGRMLFFTSGEGQFTFFSYNDVSGGDFYPNELGEGTKMLITGTFDGNVDHNWALMKKTDNSLFLIRYKIKALRSGRFWLETQKVPQLSRELCPELYDMSFCISGTKNKVVSNSEFHSTSGERNSFFFVTNNKVFIFDVNLGMYAPIIDGDEENFTITGMDCTLMNDKEGYFSQLTLCVKDRKLTGKQGGIAVYRIVKVGGTSAKKIFEKTGFCDEVIQATVKLD